MVFSSKNQNDFQWGMGGNMRSFAKPQSIVFVDKTVPDAAQVMAGLRSDIKVLLDPSRDAIAQITETLRSYRNIKTLSVISHGSIASLGFGSGPLDAASLPQYSPELRLWGDSLAPGADILLYGCNIAQGEKGKSFVSRLSSLTGADVAASVDLTGSSLRGGDWLLEYATGTIDTPTPLSDSLMASYQEVLPTLFTTQTPAQTNFTDGPGVDWEYGMRFTSSQPGQITAIRYYKAPSETGTHEGRIWSATGQQLASVTFANETASGWQQQALVNPLTIAANTTYVVSVNTNGYYATTLNGFAAPLINGALTAPVGAGVYNETSGVFPTQVYQNENYFRDVDFTPSAPNPNNNPGSVGISGTPTQSQTLTAAVTDIDGLPATISYQWQQSGNGTTWSNITAATARTLTLQQAQVGQRVRATATYADLRGNSETATSDATSAVENVNDVGLVTISGTPTQRQTLTATVTDVDGLPAAINYQWQQSVDNGTIWTAIAGATARTLTLQQDQVGKRVRATASYLDLLGRNEAINSTPTATAVANINDVGVVTISGAPIQGQALTANVTDIDGLPATINYQWQQSSNGTTWSNVTGATARTLTLQAAQVGRQIRARATYTDALGTLESNRTSAATPFVTAANNSLGTATITGTARQNEVLTVTVADTNGLPTTINYQWQQSSNNGTTWNTIANATARTLTLQQAQVGQPVRAIATYVDLAGNSETVTSNLSSSVENVNDPGAVAISGIPTQGQTLTADVTDLDGLPATINYEWQQSSNGTTWNPIVGATARTLALQQTQVGEQVRVTAVYTDALGARENITSLPTSSVSPPGSGPISIFTNQTPSQPNFTDGPGVDWEYGMKFTSSQPGVIQAVRYWKAAGESGTHVGRIWSSTGQQLASVTFTNETASGWQQQALATPWAIDAGTTYVVSVNANSHYAVTSNGFAAAITNTPLTAPVGAGVYNQNAGAFPTLVYQNENYFRDVVFAPGSSVALRDNSTIFVSETAGAATVTVVRTGNAQERMTVEYTTNEIGGVGAATAGVDYTQPALNGRANTGQVVFEIGDTSKTFEIPIVNDSTPNEGNETFAIGLQNPSSGSLGAPRTTLITIVDNDSPPTIAMSQPAVTVSEGSPTATVTLQRSGSIDGTATVDFATSDGTASAGSDYTATTSGTVSFAVGQLTQTISIPILNDTVAEPDETFSVTLSNPSSGVSLGSQTTATVTILDNDSLGNLVRQTVVTGLSEPTALDWTPDGRYMAVAQQNGVVRLVDNGVLRSTPLVDLSNQVNYTPGDRGLLGIAIHPDFASKPYVYLLHTYDPPETAGRSGLAGPDTQGNRPSRLVRLTVNPTTMVADPATLVVILGTNSTWAYTSRPDVNSNGVRNIPPSGIVNGSNNSFDNGFGITTVPANQIDAGAQDNDPDRAGTQNLNIRDYLASDGDSHSNGAVHFGPDGWLYVSNGDGTSYNFADPRSVRVQDVNNLSGKILRINPDTGEGVPGNPFYDGDPNSNRSKVFYSGVRNAFRFTFDPATNRPVVGDVGWTSWEEINTGAPGSNFGWPYLEGPNRTGQYQSLDQAITFYNNGNKNPGEQQPAVFPILSRSHGAPDNATAVVVGDFYNSNTLVFGDLLNGNLYAATLSDSRQVTNVQVFDSNIPNIVDMEMGPDGRLYGVDLAAGSIRRWVDAGTTVGATLAAPV
jgi:glucose/arabinose dehydrogenase